MADAESLYLRCIREGEMLLQSFVTPIFTYEFDAFGMPRALKLMGTGFFVGKGIFLTAAHVLRNASTEISAGNATGVCANPTVRRPDGSDQNRFIPITEYHEADTPYDVAVAVTEYDVVSPRALSTGKVEIANDISAMGYPESAFQMHQGVLYVQARVHRGYVQRVIPPNRHVMGQNNPPMIELSFPVTKGMSGSPLLMMENGTEYVVGVCVGSYTSRLADYSTTYVEDGGEKFTETQVKVQEYGLAHDLTSLLDWCPDVLGGRSIREAGT